MYIDKYGNRWYRGNLHTHTTISDGARSPEETKAIYRNMGYDFVALTDHWKYGDGSEADPSGLLVLSGAEYNYNGSDVLAGVFHIVGFGTEHDPEVTLADGAQGAVDKINDCGGLAILAHPAWSMNTYDMVMPFRGLFATEIYNSVSGLPRNCRPYSGIIVDQLAARGYVLPLVADDDTHFHTGEEGMSYIMVNLGDKPLTRDNLMAALRENSFIATQAPFFECVREGDEIVVRSETPVSCVTFYTNCPWEAKRNVTAEDEPIYEARFALHPGVSFVRAEVTDAEGKIGFAQIITV
ncbi:MAG: hypothetical protein IJ428_02915 [Clostridia bacterium]|nr:hypothetical protein [Clostridia bacterium]